MISTIKTWLLGIASVLAAVFFGLFQSQRAARAKEKLNASEKARKTEKKATSALLGGLKNEQEASDAKVGNSTRNHFE